MPIPEPSRESYTQALEIALSQANADKAAKDGFLQQLLATISAQDQQIADLEAGSMPGKPKKESKPS